MFASLRSRLSNEVLPRFQQWTSDRSPDQIEGEHLLDEGEYARAEIRLAIAIVDSERKRQNIQQRIALRLELAEAQRNQGRAGSVPAKLAAAERTTREALELATRGGDRELQVRCLDYLSEILLDTAQADEMEQVTQQAIRLEATLRTSNPLFHAKRLQRLAQMMRRTGRVGDAVIVLEESVILHEKIHGSESLETANQLTELGDVYRFLGDHAKAQTCLLRALQIHERVRGLDSPEATHDLHLLTGSYEATGDYASAAALHERILSRKLLGVGIDLEEIAQVQAQLAQRHVRWGNISRARELLSEAIGTFKRTKGPRLAEAYEALAEMEEDCGHLQEAWRQFALAAPIWEAEGDNRALLRNLECRAQLLERLQQLSEAAHLRDQASALRRGGQFAQVS
jgi:tetratricopeptide (TPR) repeat protein